MTENSWVLEARDLDFKYGRKQVLESVSISIKPGEIVGLLGPNGAGKTTAFRLLSGEYPSPPGQILLQGRDVSNQALWKRARCGLSYVPQQSTILSGLSVEQNIELGLKRMPSEVRTRVIDDALTHFGLVNLRSSLGSQLSGGESRRVELARAFASRPEVMLVDEPFAALDPMAADEVCRYLREFALSGTGILLSDHDVAQALSLCDRIYILSEGKIIFVGTPEQVAQNARVRDTYLGERLSKAYI